MNSYLPKDVWLKPMWRSS